MAGLFDDFSRAPSANLQALEAASKAQSTKRRSDFENDPGASRKERAGRLVVSGLLGLSQTGIFGDKIKGMATEEDSPELTEARANAVIAKQIQELEGDPSSAEYALRAAKIAAAAGRPDLGLRYAEAGGLRQKAEAAAEAARLQALREEKRRQFGELPTVAQEEAVALQPSILVEALGVSMEEAQPIADAVAERNEFERLEAKSKLDAVKAATTTAVTGPAKEAAASILQTRYGVGPGSFAFTGDEEEAAGFTEIVAGEVRKRVDQSRDKGRRITDAQALDEIMTQLRDSGAIALDDRWLSDTKKLTIKNEEAFASVFGVAPPPVKGQKASAAPIPKGTVIDLSGD